MKRVDYAIRNICSAFAQNAQQILIAFIGPVTPLDMLML